MTRTARSFLLSGCLATLFGLGACSQSQFEYEEQLPPPPPGVSEESWSKADISCSNKDDCRDTEACVDNVCQMRRCDKGPYDSPAPMGQSHYWIDGYKPDNQSIGYASDSWNFGSAKVVDIAGGSLDGNQPERFVAALEGSTEVHIYKKDGIDRLDVGFQPIAVAAADTDFDNVDEIIALSVGGKFALCDASEGTCDNWSFEGNIVGKDVAAADSDGDRYAEAIFLIKNEGTPRLVSWNPHNELTGEDQLRGMSPGDDYFAVAAGDTNGDGVAEVMGLKGDSGVNPFDNDTLHIYNFDGEGLARAGEQSVDQDAKDVTIADLNTDDEAEVIVLRDTNTVDVYRQEGGPGSIGLVYTGELSVSEAPERIAAADIDGDSPVATKIAGPELVPGPVVPVAAANFPPYDGAHSGGGGVLGAGGSGKSYIFFGQTENTSESYTDSASVSYRRTYGIGFEAFDIGFKVKRQFEDSISHSETIEEKKIIGSRFHIVPDPDLHGPSYGVVMLSSGCFHAYRYRMNDPKGTIGAHADGGEFVGLVPVDGQISLWSTNRYNALAEALGTLPKIEINTELGNVDSYPATPERIDGTPIPPEHMVFPEPPQFLVSDVGKQSWWLGRGEIQQETTAMESSRAWIGSASSPVADLEGARTTTIGSAYSISLGNEVVFSGGVPPIPNDPNTPEDEYEAHHFSFSPYVYRETYTTAEGEETGFYMLNYTVGQ